MNIKLWIQANAFGIDSRSNEEIPMSIIGVLGGSFCPPTNAHLELSRQCLAQGLCDHIIWVPVNDFYRKETNIPAIHRIKMIDLALKNQENISCSLHEMELDHTVYTIDSLRMIQMIRPNDQILFIAGADKMGFKWFQKETMLKEFGYIVVNRGDMNCEELINNSPNLSKYREKIRILNYKSDISSTMVREQINNNGYSDLINPMVMKYIQESNCFA